MKNLIIIGAGGHGRVVLDVAQNIGRYEKISFIDDWVKKECLGIPVVGKTSDVDKYLADSDIFVAIGNAEVRKEISEKLLAKGASMPILIHPSAVVSNSVSIGVGSVVMAGAVINSCAKLGKGVIVNTCASVDHESTVGDYSHVSVGARVAGSVKVGSCVFMGAGAVIINNKSVAGNIVIGAGAVVVNNLTEKGTYVGVPAVKIK